MVVSKQRKPRHNMWEWQRLELIDGIQTNRIQSRNTAYMSIYLYNYYFNFIRQINCYKIKWMSSHQWWVMSDDQGIFFYYMIFLSFSHTKEKPKNTQWLASRTVENGAKLVFHKIRKVVSCRIIRISIKDTERTLTTQNYEVQAEVPLRWYGTQTN